MIDYEMYSRIRYAHEQEHLSVRQIARKLGVDRKTVRRWIHRKNFGPCTAGGGKLHRPSKLDGFKGTVMGLLESHPYTAVQLLPRLREQGYSGGYTILKAYVRSVRPKRAPAFLTLHFAPGQCAQADWGSAGSIRVGNTRRALSFFVMVLCHSRRAYLEFTLGQSQEQWLLCHQHAFEYFGGLLPAEVMVDNCKTAVLSHPVGGPPILNPRYLDFANHCGFAVKACGPRKPNEKGRVESGVGYVKTSFLSGLGLTDFAAINPAARIWLDTIANVRIHGETKRSPLELFAEEKGRLRPLPALPYDTGVVRTTPVSARCRVVVDTNRYSVPSRYASKLLTLKLYADRLRLFDGDTFVAEHVRSFERQRDFEQPDHVRELVQQRKKAQQQALMLRFLRLSARAQGYYDQLAERRLNGAHHVQKIVALSEIYGDELVGRALEDAHELGAFSCEYIANLLEQRQRFVPEAGALHLTRPSDQLEIELPPPDLSPYDRPEPTSQP
ncbi:MAG: IS21 family transposase [Opitutales bacterium]|nr:IS21 family transposase [Opitutales bacterium]